MTAPIDETTAVRHVGRACHTAAEGRRFVRALGQWCARFQLSEPEFQVLWCLRGSSDGGFDQTTLAKRLAFSAAQVSATVEKLRVRGWISQRPTAGDRRRNLWHLSECGGSLIHAMLGAAHELRLEPLIWVDGSAAVISEREAAA